MHPPGGRYGKQQIGLDGGARTYENPCLMAKERTGTVYFEDVSAGDTFQTGEVTVTREMIKEFARAYDPQPIHIDEEAAKKGFFGELVGSGWHTAALTMKLMAEAAPLGDTPMIGLEVRNFKFLAPLKPGMTLSADGQVAKARRSKSNPNIGFIYVDVITKTNAGEPILTQTWTVILPVKNPEN